jgi:hypothetical protein
MPSTVADILAAAGAAPDGVVQWGERPPVATSPPTTGIYVVALTGDVDSCAEALETPPISKPAIDDLLAIRPELTLDGARPSRDDVFRRLAAFWFPDEIAVYIGLAGPRRKGPAQGEIAKRVAEYYSTPLGANGPHAGGWPLKTLSCLPDLYVHYAYCGDVRTAEDSCLAQFAAQVSDETLEKLHDPVRVMPFANLEFPRGNAKNHGIRGARAPRAGRAVKSGVPPARARARPARALRNSAAQSRAVTAHHRSQNVTANDIETGQVRIPIGATKQVFPPARQSISVVLRGRKLNCRWDPRYGAKERSGIIRVGKAAAGELLSPGDVLAVTVTADKTIDLS